MARPIRNGRNKSNEKFKIATSSISRRMYTTPATVMPRETLEKLNSLKEEKKELTLKIKSLEKQINTPEVTKYDIEKLKLFFQNINIEELEKINVYHATLMKILSSQIEEEYNLLKENLILINEEIEKLEKQRVVVNVAVTLPHSISTIYENFPVHGHAKILTNRENNPFIVKVEPKVFGEDDEKDSSLKIVDVDEK